MILRDGNVVSELARPMLSPQVEAWFSRHAPEHLFLTAITETELRLGLLLMPRGHRRDEIAGVVDAIIEVDFVGRFLAFNHEAAGVYADIFARGE